MIKIGKNISRFSKHSYQPKTKKELIGIINSIVSESRSDKCDLNMIDTSLITDMSYLFNYAEFNGDISRWNVSNVNNMVSMFNRAKFAGDISKWKIREDCNTINMFIGSRIKEELKPNALSLSI